MKTDWYEKAYNQFLDDIAFETAVHVTNVQSVYSYLVNVGLIDYDMEKDFLYEEYVDDED
jgi:hypothetical protein